MHNAVLVVEVSEISLASDQTTKAAIYAKYGIGEYWILNLRQRQLEIRRDPGQIGEEFGYRFLQLVMADGTAAPLAAPDQPIRVLDMLPSELTANGTL